MSLRFLIFYLNFQGQICLHTIGIRNKMSSIINCTDWLIFIYYLHDFIKPIDSLVSFCVPFIGSEAWTSSLRYKTIDEWRSWSFIDQIARYINSCDI